jgi:hypothetical protein
MAAAPTDQAKTRPLRILVAVPSTGGVFKSKTATSLFRLASALTANGAQPSILNLDGSDVITVRNMYANLVLDSDRWDALLFVDSDMEFEPRLVLRMLKLNADVVGVACTTRALDLGAYRAALGEHGDDTLARAQASRFNVLLTFDNKRGATIHHRDGFYSLAAVGMAVCLIRKRALQAMVAEGAVDKRQDVKDLVVTETHGFFDHLDVSGIRLLEDFSFCYRWTEKMGRKLWVCVDEQVGHIGEFTYGAKYKPVLEKQLQLGAAPTDKTPAAKTPAKKSTKRASPR